MLVENIQTIGTRIPWSIQYQLHNFNRSSESDSVSPCPWYHMIFKSYLDILFSDFTKVDLLPIGQNRYWRVIYFYSWSNHVYFIHLFKSYELGFIIMKKKYNL